MYVLVETIIFLAGMVYLGKKFAAYDRRQAVLAPDKPAPSDNITAFTAHDRITARQRPYIASGLLFENINSPTAMHFPQMLQNRTQNPTTRAMVGDSQYYGDKDPHRRAQALARLSAGAPQNYWGEAIMKV